MLGNPGFGFGCSYDYGGAETLIQPVERTQGVARAAWQFDPNNQLIFEATASRVDATKFFVILPDSIGHGKSSKPSDGLRARHTVAPRSIRPCV